ncbi:Endonuclease III-like protein [Trichinella spiralis]|uniref:Endonuclease III-like protein n=1 Tax=Trichinella spiralis TaxID=6334 RepID=A0ABR3KUA4_TRISP
MNLRNYKRKLKVKVAVMPKEKGAARRVSKGVQQHIQSRPKRACTQKVDCVTDIESVLEAEMTSKKVISQWVPSQWKAQLENIQKMRSQRLAPVDTVGCSKLFDPGADEKTKRYQILLSLMLSSQTKDEITAAAMTSLKKYGCSVNKILQTDESDLAELIYPVGFCKSKAKYIKKTTEILQSQYDGDIPKSVDELCQLPGVGPKMALLTMLTAWNQCEGIAVDTHVHRISNRLGWLPSPTKQPEQTRKGLENWLPKSYWPQINNNRRPIIGLFNKFSKTLLCNPLVETKNAGSAYFDAVKTSAIKASFHFVLFWIKRKNSKTMVGRNRSLHKVDYKEEMVYLFQPPRSTYIPNISPFSLKLETWLRMNEIPYESIAVDMTNTSKKGQLPFVELNGKEIADSNFIIDELSVHFKKEDCEDKTALEKATLRAFESLIEDSLSWVVVVIRSNHCDVLFNDNSFIRLLPAAFRPIRAIAAKIFSNKLKTKAFHQGIGRHSLTEVTTIGQNLVKAISVFLGDKTYLSGEKPTKLDAVAFGHLGQLWYTPVESDLKKFIESECANIVQYLERMKTSFWPDWAQLCVNQSVKVAKEKASDGSKGNAECNAAAELTDKIEAMENGAEEKCDNVSQEEENAVANSNATTPVAMATENAQPIGVDINHKTILRENHTISIKKYAIQCCSAEMFALLLYATKQCHNIKEITRHYRDVSLKLLRPVLLSFENDKGA